MASHAHDDHTAGLAEIYNAAKGAKFVTSAALTSSEFFHDLMVDEDIAVELVESVRREFRSVYNEVASRGAVGAPHLLKAIEDKVLFSGETWESGPIVKVIALSPSDQAIVRSQLLLADGAGRSDRRGRLSVADPNEFTVAIWVEIGDADALLFGGDLLIGPTACGWRRIVEHFRPTALASLFKIPHHGSREADYEPVWEKLLMNSPTSILTPFRVGRPIPKAGDIERLSKKSGTLHITANAQPPARSLAVKATDSLLPSFATNVRERDGLAGHIQARRKFGAAKWSIRASPPAHRLK